MLPSDQQKQPQSQELRLYVDAQRLVVPGMLDQVIKRITDAYMRTTPPEMVLIGDYRFIAFSCFSA